MAKALSWRIGEVTVTRVVENEGSPTPVGYILEGATAEHVKPHTWLQPHFANDAGDIFLSFHAFLIQAPGATIVVDTCMGNDRKQAYDMLSFLKTPFLENFKATGVKPEDVTHVFCTHLHFDHVGWNVRLEGDMWVPTFPKARYLFDKAEYESLRKFRDAADPHADHYPVAIAPIVDGGLATFINADGYKICDEIRLMSTPGHTVGHASVVISSKGQEAIITGDMVHNPVQCAIPEHPVVPDEDKAHGARTRKQFMEKFADSKTMILGTHFPPPTSGYIEAAGKSWRFRGGRNDG